MTPAQTKMVNSRPWRKRPGCRNVLEHGHCVSCHLGVVNDAKLDLAEASWGYKLLEDQLILLLPARCTPIWSVVIDRFSEKTEEEIGECVDRLIDAITKC